MSVRAKTVVSAIAAIALLVGIYLAFQYRSYLMAFAESQGLTPLTWDWGSSPFKALIGLAVIAGLVGIGYLVHRHLYVRSLLEKGWQWDSDPKLAMTNGLSCPPFGVGFGREVDDQIFGTTKRGVPFNVFEYKQEGKVRLVAMKLRYALPEYYLAINRTRPAISVPQQGTEPAVFAKEADYAARVTAAIQAPLQAYEALDNRVDLSIDGDQLVVIDLPAKADPLETRLEALADVALAINEADLDQWAQPAPPQRVGFYGTDWTYADRDDVWLARTDHTGGGQEHRAEDVVYGPNDGLSFVGYTHRWETEHTRTTTDSEGRTRTETYTVQHDEPILEVFSHCAFSELSVNTGGPGEKVQFEGLGFNKQFKVTTVNRKFAYDVIHPRQMEFMTAVNAPAFSINQQGTMQFDVPRHSLNTIIECTNFAHGFLGRVPSFVWEDLGVTELPEFRQITPEPARSPGAS